MISLHSRTHLIRCAFASIAALFFFSCSTADDSDSVPIPADLTTYLALGDSYTIGEGVNTGQRFPAQLEDSLAAQGVLLDRREIIAQTGWRTDNLQQAIDEADLPTNSYDLVTLLIGVNDQFQGRDLDGFRQNLDGLLDEARRVSKTGDDGIILISIPDYSVTPFAMNSDTARIRTEIDLYNGAVAAAADQRSLAFVNVTPISRLARMDRSLLASDGLHPSARMYADWIGQLLPVATAMLTD